MRLPALALLVAACGGASAVPPAEVAPVVEEPVRIEGPFRGYIRDGYDYRIYGDFDAIRRSRTLAGASDELHAWFRDRRPDVRAVFNARGLHPLDHATRGLLVEAPGWEWVFTIDYPAASASVEQSLEAAVLPPWTEEGSFRVAPIRGHEPPALVAHPHDGRLVITTPASMAPASRIEPVEIDFVAPGALVSFDSPRSQGGFFGVPLFHGEPLRLTAHLFDRGELLEVVGYTEYASQVEAADATLRLQQIVREYEANPLVRMAGLSDMLGRIRIRVDATKLVLEAALTAAEATLLARLALDSIELPEGM
jgi:hypothetical protein